METKTLESVLQEKVHRKIEESQKRAIPTLEAIEREGSSLTDFIAPMGSLNNQVGMNFISNGSLKAELINGDKFKLHQHAVQQAGEKLGIPTRYIRDLAGGQDQWERDLAAKILNEHSQHTHRQRVLVRSIDDEIRGILSDKYRRLNTPDIYRQFLQNTSKNGATVVDAHLTATKSYIETLIPQIFPVQTEKNGVVHIAFGARISSSDFGDGSLNVRTFFMQAVCLNGMVRESVVNERHLGSRIPDNIAVSESTYRKDTEAMASLVGDIVGDLLSPRSLEEQVANINKAASHEINLENEIKKLPTAGVLKSEVKLLEDVLRNGRESDGVAGEPTTWKLTQALTAVARDSEPARRRDLEEIAGKMLDKVVKKK